MSSLPSRRFAFLALFFLASASIVGAQQGWRILHPGQGGQVQDITLAPAQPGRLYVLSDVEGLYRSDDFGESYRHIAEGIHNSMCFELACDPSDAGRIYLGTIRGLLISDDAGETWRPLEFTMGWRGTDDAGGQNGMPIATIEIDPTDPQTLYFANSWKIKDGLPVWTAFGFSNAFNATNSDLYHTGRIWRSRDRGETWTELTFEPVSGYMNIHSIVVNPANPAQIFVSAHSGLYVSNDRGDTWTKINTPAGAYFGRGATITPDGEWVYACFTVENTPIAWRQSAPNGSRNPPATIFAARNQGTNWTWHNRGTGLGSSSDANDAEYAYPAVSPDSTGANHTVLLGTAIGSAGLWQTTFTVDNAANSISDPGWTRIFGNPAPPFEYIPGWDTYNITGRYYEYTPPTWPEKRIWTTGNQTMFEGDPSALGWPTSLHSWRERYSRLIGTTDGVRTYQHRGTASSINWDVDADGLYAVQAMSDNGIAESVDGGVSWTRLNGPGVPNGQAAYIVKNTIPRVVLAGAGTGFLGGTGTVNLHASRLISDGFNSWMTNITTRGLSGGVSDFSADAITGHQVYVATSNALYQADNIHDLWNTTDPVFRSIFTGSVTRVIAHPRLANTLYILTGGGVRRGISLDGGATWSFSANLAPSNATDFAVWEYAERTYIAYTGPVAANPVAYLSDDDGASFRQIFTGNTDLPAFPWRSWIFNTSLNVTLKGIVGFEDCVMFGTGMRNQRKSLGMMKGRISGAGDALSVTWSDWATEGAPVHHAFPWVERARIGNIAGAPTVLTATQGAGTWARPATEINSPLETWRRQHFGTTAGSGPAANDADPDQDGATNLVEFALGTVPTSAGSVALPQPQITGNRLRLSFIPNATLGIRYTVQSSDDLLAWSETPVAAGDLIVGQAYTFTDSIDLGSDGNLARFLRLRVELVP
jgi:hypothetical protein